MSMQVDEKLITSPEFIIPSELGPVVLILDGRNNATMRHASPITVCKCKYRFIYWLERESHTDPFVIQRQRDRQMQPIWGKPEMRNLKLTRDDNGDSPCPNSGIIFAKRALDRALLEWEQKNPQEFIQAEAISVFQRLRRLNEREHDIEIELSLLVERKAKLEKRLKSFVGQGAQLPTPDSHPL